MNKIWYFIYNFIAIPLLFIFFHIAGLFNTKIRNGLNDRKKLFEKLIIDAVDLDRSKKLIWFHSASMGEFEQAKPIIKKLKEEKNVNILITFFSPSGYRNSLNYPYAEIISYLPFDTPQRVRRFLNITKPDLVVLMRYDIWPNLIWQLSSKNIPSFIVDATMANNSKRKLPLVKQFHDSIYKCFTKILTVSENDSNNFSEFKIQDNKIEFVGDTRYDRVYQKSIDAINKELFISGFFKGKKVFVFGSSWESDEEVLIPAFIKLMKYDPDVHMIVCPHEPTLVNLEKLENRFEVKNIDTIRFSYLNNYNSEKIIIIDSIGILLTLYYYADVAYVGGSFKQGIHNVLEPAVYGIPVFFGPKMHNSLEAKLLVEKGGAAVIKNTKQAYKFLRRIFSDSERKEKMGNICAQFVEANSGATGKICDELEVYING